MFTHYFSLDMCVKHGFLLCLAMIFLGENATHMQNSN